MTVLFSSPQSGENVEKHFQNLQNSMQTISFYEGSDHAKNDLEVNIGPTTFQSHFEEIVANAPVDEKGEPNEYYSRTFMPNLVKYFLPQAPLWSGLMLGDLGRHGKGPAYKSLSKLYMRCSQLATQAAVKGHQKPAEGQKTVSDTCLTGTKPDKVSPHFPHCICLGQPTPNPHFWAVPLWPHTGPIVWGPHVPRISRWYWGPR
ncbi:hypothetical protein QQF64_033886 [Cirrhinus molitorella]|uniref:Uncharacterized protein n=1 Tax=Cirrhinus molitorella TaxID=172907 RepID=A0ABR3MV51_9TELE